MMDSDSSDNSLTDGDIDLDTEEDVEEDAGEVDEERKSCAQVSSKPVRKAAQVEICQSPLILSYTCRTTLLTVAVVYRG